VRMGQHHSTGKPGRLPLVLVDAKQEQPPKAAKQKCRRRAMRLLVRLPQTKRAFAARARRGHPEVVSWCGPADSIKAGQLRAEQVTDSVPLSRGVFHEGSVLR